MEQLERLGPEHLRSAMASYRDVLRSHQEQINRLNVYPVPDGDTGTNMALTLESVVTALDAVGGGEAGARGGEDMAARCHAISRGSLMGARGNSGVILSQVLRGLVEVLREVAAAGPDDLARALRSASKAADGAVSRPVEGTILTVVRASADGAEEAAGQGKALVDVVERARSAAADALDRTPEMLPVLARAGVVDAGGLGFLLFHHALLHVGAGQALPRPDGPVGPVAAGISDDAGGEEAGDGDGADLRYEVMFFLEAPDDAVPAFREAWDAVGDSIVVAGGDGLWNCHIHTDDIGASLEAALDCGRPRGIHVTDLKEQVAEEQCIREAVSADDAPQGEEGGDKVSTAVVVVGAGEGLEAMFHSLGAHAVVAGGQSMNPSTADILAAVEKAPAEAVVVLPNNKNVVAVAEQVDALTEKTVRVVGTHAVAEGLAALLEYDPQAPPDENVDAMTGAAGQVAWGEVTRAVRSSTCELGAIGEGDWLGISSRRIEAVASSPDDAAVQLLDVLLSDHHEVVTVIEGEGAQQSGTSRITAWLTENHPEVAAEVHHGGQPLYRYLLSAE